MFHHSRLLLIYIFPSTKCPHHFHLAEKNVINGILTSSSPPQSKNVFFDSIFTTKSPSFFVISPHRNVHQFNINVRHHC